VCLVFRQSIHTHKRRHGSHGGVRGRIIQYSRAVPRLKDAPRCATTVLPISMPASILRRGHQPAAWRYHPAQRDAQPWQRQRPIGGADCCGDSGNNTAFAAQAAAARRREPAAQRRCVILNCEVSLLPHTRISRLPGAWLLGLAVPHIDAVSQVGRMQSAEGAPTDACWFLLAQVLTSPSPHSQPTQTPAQQPAQQPRQQSLQPRQLRQRPQQQPRGSSSMWNSL